MAKHDDFERGLLAIRAKLEGKIDNLPSALELVSWAREITTDRGGPFRILRMARKTTSDEARCVLAQLGWHSGGGSLWGPMGQAMRLGTETFDRCDTAATILRYAFGKRGSSAVATWKRALGW